MRSLSSWLGMSCLSLCLIWQTPLRATAIVAVRDGKRVVVVADSAVTLGGGETSRVAFCKVVVLGTVLVGIAGRVVKNKALAYDLHALVRENFNAKTQQVDLERVMRQVEYPLSHAFRSMKRGPVGICKIAALAFIHA